MTKFRVFIYHKQTSTGRRRLYTLRDDEPFDRSVMVLAPLGTTIRDPTDEDPTLKIPKPGRSHEFWVLDAEEVIIAASEGKYDLKLVDPEAKRESA